MKYGHLERLNITLRALGPVFIGSGESLNKKEYIFDARKGLIYFPDLPRLVTFLKSRSLLPKYEDYLYQQRHNDFRVFLKENGIGEADYPSFVGYSIEAGEAAQSAYFRQVLTFIKDSAGYPYIPGSSVKGAVRTALAAMLIKEGRWDSSRREITGADSSVNARKFLAREEDRLEKRIFYRLGIRDPREGGEIYSPVNDLMRGVSISDSAPLSFETLTLTGKYDRKPDGAVNSLPIFREVIKPGSEARLIMTLNTAMLAKAGLNAKSIEAALHSFADEHYANFEQYFAETQDDATVSAQQGVDIILGGGAGYVSKTLVYNLFPQREQALDLAAIIMAKQFPPRHGHGKDAAVYKVSPHTLKTAMYVGQYYQMGRCELIVE